MSRARETVDISPHRGLFDLGLAELFAARELILRFALRGLTLRYRQTLLGALWVVLSPLLASGVLSVVFGTFAGLSAGDSPYLLTVYAGLLPWLLLSRVIARGGTSLVAERNLITKVYLPRMALPLSSLLPATVDVLLPTCFFVPLALASGRPLGASLLALPALYLPLLLTCAAAVLVVAALNVFYRDVQQGMTYFLQLLLFASPIAYPLASVRGDFAWLVHLNPLVGAIEAFRWALLGGRDFPLASFAYTCAFSVVALALGLVFFRRVERALADVI